MIKRSNSCTCRGARRTTSWMVPREFPSDDIEHLRVSMAAWLDLPRSDSPFTAISWSFTHNRPSCWEKMNELSTVILSNFNSISKIVPQTMHSKLMTFKVLQFKEETIYNQIQVKCVALLSKCEIIFGNHKHSIFPHKEETRHQSVQNPASVLVLWDISAYGIMGNLHINVGTIKAEWYTVYRCWRNKVLSSINHSLVDFSHRTVLLLLNITSNTFTFTKAVFFKLFVYFFVVVM